MKKFLLILLFVTQPAIAADTFGVFVGAGPGWTFPAAVRVNYKEWELGLMTGSFAGIAKIASRGSLYASFGVGGLNGVGFFTAVGWRPKLVGPLYFRGEYTAVALHNGFTRAEAIAGLHLGF